MNTNSWLTYLVFTLILLGAIIVGTAWGEVTIPISRTSAILLDSLWHCAGGRNNGWDATILIDVRLPRVLVAALAGGGLALAGAVMQGIFQNPMADPGVLGISSGASLGAVVMLYSGVATNTVFFVPAGALAGALTASFLVYYIATSKAHSSIATLLLAGMAISSICTASTSFVLTLALRRWEIGRQILSWTLGNLEGRSWSHVVFLAPIVIGGCALLITYSRFLNVLMTGENHALAVGVDVVRVRRNLLLLTSLVTAATVAVVGVVGFVGLIVPHIMRLIVGPDNRRLLGCTFLGGATFVVLADTLCRSVGIQDLRLGVVTALLGGPWFLYLLLKTRKQAYTL